MRSGARVTNAGLIIWALLLVLTLGAGTSPKTAVPLLALSMSDRALQSLQTNPRKYVLANVQIDGKVYPDVKVHLKGSGSFQPIDQKPSFTLSFPENSPFGAKKIHLHNSVEDGTFLQEKIGRALFARIGITTPPVSHARVSLNGHSKGLYVLEETESGATYDKDSLSEPPLADLLEAAREPDLNLRWKKLGALLEREEFISFIAMEVFICHWDGYALAENNFRIRRSPSTGRFIFLPAGMDQIFGNPNYPVEPNMGGALARAVLEIPEARREFDARLAELANALDLDVTIKQARADLGRLPSSVRAPESAEMREATDELCARMAARKRFVQSQFRTMAFAQ